MQSLDRLNRWMMYLMSFTIVMEIVLNFIGSYGHIYVEGIEHGEYGVDARILPITVDGVLLALAIANVVCARLRGKSHWGLRLTLAFGVGCTVAANAAYGASWGLTGGFLSVWAPVALFITVESGLLMFKIIAEYVAKENAPRRGRPPGSQTRTPRRPPAAYSGGREIAIPIIHGRVDPFDPFSELREDAA